MSVDLARGVNLRYMSIVKVNNSATSLNFGLGPPYLHLRPNGVNLVLQQSTTEMQAGMQAGGQAGN